MLSKQMYEVLSCFPRKLGKPIKFEELVEKCSLEETEIVECLEETLFPSWNYIRSSNGWNKGSELFLTETGLAKIESHEQQANDQEVVCKSLDVARIAMWVSIVSAAVAIASLVKMFF